MNKFLIIGNGICAIANGIAAYMNPDNWLAVAVCVFNLMVVMFLMEGK